jgi:conjugal transfer pilus assembly protein TraA
MKIAPLLKKLGVGLAATGMSAMAFAENVAADDTFYTFAETVTQWTSGGLGVGLATTMLLMGGAIGVAKNSPMPALTGIAGAAFLHWGPEVIRGIMVKGSLV